MYHQMAPTDPTLYPFDSRSLEIGFHVSDGLYIYAGFNRSHTCNHFIYEV
jgi:hypothetical protein